MGEETSQPERTDARKRRAGLQNGGKRNKKMKMPHGKGKKVKVDKRMKELFRKRAREYNSDDDADDTNVLHHDDVPANRATHVISPEGKVDPAKKAYEEPDDQDIDEENGSSGEDMDDIEPVITKFAEGCRAFRIAFKKIIKKNVSEDSLGPVLSGHQKLVIEKLAEEESEQKVKGNAKKEKHLVKEKCHVKPANFLDSHEKFLISVATKGVVKLFNAVNKAQSAQKKLNPLRSKDARVIRKQRKEAFFSELGKPAQSADATAKNTSTAQGDGKGPAWAPLRDNYMLTNPKLKNWDKMQDTAVGDAIQSMPMDSSSDDDDE